MVVAAPRVVPLTLLYQALEEGCQCAVMLGVPAAWPTVAPWVAATDAGKGGKRVCGTPLMTVSMAVSGTCRAATVIAGMESGYTDAEGMLVAS